MTETLDGEEEKRRGTSPEDVPGLTVRAMGPAGGASVRHFLYSDVLEELRKAAFFREEPALALLTGSLALDEHGPFVEVTGFQDLNYLFGDDAIKLVQHNLAERLEAVRAGGDEAVVGLFVARDGEGGRPVKEDVRVHLTLFNRPFQVLLVMDGEEGKVGLYSREGWQQFENLPFFVVQESVSSRPLEEADSTADIDPEPKGLSDE